MRGYSKYALLGGLGLLLTFAVVVGWGWLAYRSFLMQALQVGDSDQVLVVNAGRSFAGIVGELRRRRLTAAYWEWRVLGWASPLTQSLQAGEYRIPPGMRPPQLLEMLAQGTVIQHELTIVEGWTYAQLREALARHPAVTPVLLGVGSEEVAMRLGLPTSHPEGWFLPETYRFPRGTTDFEFLRRAHKAMVAALDSAWQQRAFALPYASPYEALIMASIIEKETGRDDEREEIAGVFVRRLQRGMRLQADPTVIYGMAERFDGDIRARDLRSDHAYNTYTRAGLPPTPIALPGLAALLAALQPAPGATLYFVARGDGSHQFSVTLEEHNAAVQRYQRSGG